MAERHIIDNKHFVHRLPGQKSKANVISQNGSKSNVSSESVQPQADLPMKTSPHTLDTSHAEITPVRRVVVVRNSKNPQLKQKPVDLGEFGQSDAAKVPPVVTNGVSILFYDEIFRFIHKKIF
jgi:hypothetical protein